MLFVYLIARLWAWHVSHAAPAFSFVEMARGMTERCLSLFFILKGPIFFVVVQSCQLPR